MDRVKYRPYTGVGSRETPTEVQELFSEWAFKLGQHRLTLRSGSAQGADLAFERGCDLAGGSKEIYLPWLPWPDPPRLSASPEAIEIAARTHPNWGTLDEHARALHARNVHQVLGENLDSPSLFLICWTPGGKTRGGTATSLRVAREHGVPCFNLGSVEWSLVEIIEQTMDRRRRGR